MASTQLTPQFTALNGLEVKKALLKEIERHLNADTRFSQHLTYARLMWKWKFASNAYPDEIGEIRIELEGEIPPRAVQRPIADDEEPTQIDMAGGTTVASPVAGVSADQVRRDAGLPIPTPRTVRGIDGARMTVDDVQVPKPARESQEEGGDTPQVVTNKPTGKGVVARSTTLRTRANPKGVNAVERAGSPPTAEDAQEIIDRGLADGTLVEVQPADGADRTED